MGVTASALCAQHGLTPTLVLVCCRIQIERTSSSLVPDSGASQDRRGVWSGALIFVVLTRTVAWERSPHETQGWERQYGSTLHRH